MPLFDAKHKVIIKLLSKIVNIIWKLQTTDNVYSVWCQDVLLC